MIGVRVFLDDHAQQEPTGGANLVLVNAPSFNGRRHLAGTANYAEDVGPTDAAPPPSQSAHGR
jgi:hypothetical protein